MPKKLKDLSFVIVPIVAIVALVAAIEMSSGKDDAKGDAKGGEKPATITVEQADAAGDAKSGEKPAAVTVEKADAEGDTKGGEKPATMTARQADAALRRVIPNVTVESVAPSPVEGLWEVVVVTPQGKRIAYIDAEGRFLVSGTIIDLSSGTDLTRERFADLNRVNFASINLDDAIVMGNPNAARKVVVFDDPD